MCSLVPMRPGIEASVCVVLQYLKFYFLVCYIATYWHFSDAPIRSVVLARDEVWAEVWVLRIEVEVWGLRLGFLRCEVQVGVLRFEVGVWGLRLGTLLYPTHRSVPSSVPPVAGKEEHPEVWANEIRSP